MSATLLLPKFIHELGAVCPKSNARFTLAGINFKVDDVGKASACVTDGKILVKVDLDDATDIGGAISVTLDPKSLKTALVACHSKQRPPMLRITDEACTVTGNGASMVVQKIEGVFPEIEDVIPKDVSTIETTNASVHLNPELVSRLCLALFRACGKSADDPRFAFAFHGPKMPVRVDFKGDTFSGVGVIMPISPPKK